MADIDERFNDIATRLERDDPAFAESFARGRPRRPREYRRGRAVLALVAAGAALCAGVVIGHGLLIAAGLVALGCVTQLWPYEPRPPESPDER